MVTTYALPKQGKIQKNLKTLDHQPAIYNTHETSLDSGSASAPAFCTLPLRKGKKSNKPHSPNRPSLFNIPFFHHPVWFERKKKRGREREGDEGSIFKARWQRRNGHRQDS